MTEIKLYKSKRKVLRLLLSLPFLFIGIWLIYKKPVGTSDYYMVWVCTIFFGLAIPLIIYNLLDNRPQIIINEEGIWDRTLKQDLIKWEQIINFRLLNIHNQIFISVKVDKTFVYKNKFYKWATKLNNLVGAENLNLNLGQINVDENKLLELINNLRTTEKHLRSEKIKKFDIHSNVKSSINFNKYIAYIIILIIMFSISMINNNAFFVVLIITGICAIIARWNNGSNNKSDFIKYAEKITYLGFINLILLFMFYQICDYSIEKLGIKITNKIENYKSKHGKYPENLKVINEEVEYNPLEKYLSKKIIYTKTNNDYLLQMNDKNNEILDFEKDIKVWY